MCLARLEAEPKFFLHFLHMKGDSLLCFVVMCLFSLLNSEKVTCRQDMFCLLTVGMTNPLKRNWNQELEKQMWVE